MLKAARAKAGTFYLLPSHSHYRSLSTVKAGMGLNNVISKLIVWKKRSHMGNDSVVVVVVFQLYLRILNKHNNASFNCVCTFFSIFLRNTALL